MTDKEPLMTLKTRPDGNAGAPVRDAAQDTAGYGEASSYAKDTDLPLLGLFAVGFGLLGIFTVGPVFVPLDPVFGLVAILMRQILLGLTEGVLALAGVWK